MVELLTRIDTLELFYKASEGYLDQPTGFLVSHLINNYAVDLDMIQDFLRDVDLQRHAVPEAPRPFAALAA